MIALGAVFSALEVVPLALIGFEAWENLRLTRPTEKAPWIATYNWPIYFFVAVAFWNLVGAGLFGFLINPPIALYYMQGLNTTPVHGHTALFGVYGMLGLGLMLFCLRVLQPSRPWKQGTVESLFLAPQRWADLHGHPEHVARWPAAGVGLHRTRYVVRALGGVPAIPNHADTALDARSRRRSVRIGRRAHGLVCARIADRTLLQQARAGPEYGRT